MTGGRVAIVACGDDALRILCGEGDIRISFAAHLAKADCWMEVVPGKRDVTVAFDPHRERMDDAQARLADALAAFVPKAAEHAAQHILRAEFGGASGPDLAALAASLGLAEADIVAAVERSPLSVDMLGFTPGFAYLKGLDPNLASTRLANPRARVAAGSIGLITGQIGLYALEGPGGWPIIGRVLTPLFDRSAANPFLLQPGARVLLGRAGPA